MSPSRICSSFYTTLALNTINCKRFIKINPLPQIWTSQSRCARARAIGRGGEAGAPCAFLCLRECPVAGTGALQGRAAAPYGPLHSPYIPTCTLVSYSSPFTHVLCALPYMQAMQFLRNTHTSLPYAFHSHPMPAHNHTPLHFPYTHPIDPRSVTPTGSAPHGSDGTHVHPYTLLIHPAPRSGHPPSAAAPPGRAALHRCWAGPLPSLAPQDPRPLPSAAPREGVKGSGADRRRYRCWAPLPRGPRASPAAVVRGAARPGPVQPGPAEPSGRWAAARSPGSGAGQLGARRLRQPSPEPRGSPSRLRPGTRREARGRARVGGTAASSAGGGEVGGEGGGEAEEGNLLLRRDEVAALQRASPAARAAGTCRAWSTGAAEFLRVSQPSSRSFPGESVSWAPAGRRAHLRLPSRSALIPERTNLVVSTCHLLCMIFYSFIVLCWQVAKDF